MHPLTHASYTHVICAHTIAQCHACILTINHTHSLTTFRYTPTPTSTPTPTNTHTHVHTYTPTATVPLYDNTMYVHVFLCTYIYLVCTSTSCVCVCVSSGITIGHKGTDKPGWLPIGQWLLLLQQLRLIRTVSGKRRLNRINKLNCKTNERLKLIVIETLQA